LKAGRSSAEPVSVRGMAVVLILSLLLVSESAVRPSAECRVLRAACGTSRAAVSRSTPHSAVRSHALRLPTSC
jgi:hypothetical protein